jgi:hypothetical protein
MLAMIKVGRVDAKLSAPGPASLDRGAGLDRATEDAALRSTRRPGFRLPVSLPLWGAVLAVGWALFDVLLQAASLRVDPSFLPGWGKSFYDGLRSLLPHDWVNAPLQAIPDRAVTMLLYVALVSVLWAAYLAAVHTASRAPGRERVAGDRFHPLAGILVGTALFGGICLLWPALFSSDVYAYAVQGKMQVAHDLNPLVFPPKVMRPDPLVGLSPWQDIPSVYGPIWLIVTRGLSAVAQALGGGTDTYLLLFKALGLALLLASTALVWAIGGQLKWDAGRRKAATILFGWCPLLIIDFVGNGHNDALLVFMVLAAIWLHLRGWWPLAVAALVGGGLIKLSGYFLLPAYGVLLLRTSGNRREGVKRAAVGIAVALSVAALVYLPYMSALPGAITSQPLAGSYGPSIGLVVRRALVDIGMTLRGSLTPADLTAGQATDAVSLPIWNGALLIWGGLAIAFSLIAKDIESLLRAWGWVLFTYLVIGSVWFMPWYITWLLPLAVLLPSADRYLARACLLMAWGGTLFYALTPTIPGDRTPNLRDYYVPAIIFLPPLLYLGWVSIRSFKRNRVLKQRASSVAEAQN